MDSTFCKVHQHEAGARKTTKIHALVNEHFQLIIKLLSKVVLKDKKVLADKAFCSEDIREYIFQEKAVASIPDIALLAAVMIQI